MDEPLTIAQKLAESNSEAWDPSKGFLCVSKCVSRALKGSYTGHRVYGLEFRVSRGFLKLEGFRGTYGCD